MRFAPAPGVPGLPEDGRAPLGIYQAAVRACERHPRADPRGRPGRRGGRHPHRGRVAGGAGRGAPVGDARARTCIRWAEPGLPPYSVGAVPPRTRVGAAAVGLAAPAAVGRRGARAPRAERRARARGAGAARARARRDLARPGAGGHLPPARVPAPGRSRRRARDRPAPVGAAVRRGGAAARATTRWCWWRRAPRRTPSTSCCARRSRGWPASRCGCSPPGTGGPRRSRCPSRRTPGSSSGCPTRARCRAATRWSATPATARSPGRWPAGVPVVACPYAGDQAENAARIRWSGLGVSLPRRFQNARGVRLAVRRLLAEPTYMRRAEALKAWAEEHPGRGQRGRGGGGSRREL